MKPFHSYSLSHTDKSYVISYETIFRYNNKYLLIFVDLTIDFMQAITLKLAHKLFPVIPCSLIPR